MLYYLGNLGSSKLLENGGSNVENAPMFRTGLGKSVELKHSSIDRARSVLGEIDGSVADTSIDFLLNICYVFGYVATCYQRLGQSLI